MAGVSRAQGLLLGRLIDAGMALCDKQVCLRHLRDRRIKADEAQVAAALQGHWREEHLFALKQALALIDAYAVQITECDAKLQQLLAALKDHELPDAGLGAPKRSAPAKNSVRFDARAALYEASGVDLTRIPGIDTRTNRAAQALRMAAQALRRSQTALGAHHHRLCSRMDRPKAITASAHKLARLVYFMLTKGQAFVEAGQDEYEDRERQRVVQNLSRRAQQLGFQLTPREATSA